MTPRLFFLLLAFNALTCLLRSQTVYTALPASLVDPVRSRTLEDSHVSSPPSDCSNSTAVNIIIDEAISSGAPTYNSGNHIGCYRIYEGAAYKILFKYGPKCKDVKKTLEAALELSYGDYSSTEKAWIMRKAFDTILGVPTETR